ncbi:single-stranded DNA-binding protein [Arcanobacterium sp. S3PF19]|uniref:single-stranded DNA-binding protein n=1 Tax=Arcanobacterium sp. S3PF19 TaxID=1219585 RepID=UPI00050E4EEC|nr:single-stranded DNA-binding protein [Arcanobacterium sp. S3PF19]KGF05686.1 single-stranded DNA-binding protein [Arcanobacterium sp. S3PF19]
MAGEPIITVVGNLTANPELKYVSTGRAVANFTVASTPRTFNRQTNEWVDGEAMFIRCAVWNQYAENVAESLTKGMRVIVTGRLSVRSYQRNDGSQGTSVEMQVDEVGPALRYATASVTKAAGNSQGGFNQAGAANGSPTYDAPAGGALHDPWASAPQTPQDSAFDKNPPF